MQPRTQSLALAIFLIALSATTAVTATVQQNLQQQQSILAQIQQVPAYCQAQYARRPAGAARDQAIQMCMQQRYQSLSELMEATKRMMQQINRTQEKFMRQSH